MRLVQKEEDRSTRTNRNSRSDGLESRKGCQDGKGQQAAGRLFPFPILRHVCEVESWMQGSNTVPAVFSDSEAELDRLLFPQARHLAKHSSCRIPWWPSNTECDAGKAFRNLTGTAVGRWTRSGSDTAPAPDREGCERNSPLPRPTVHPEPHRPQNNHF